MYVTETNVSFCEMGITAGFFRTMLKIRIGAYVYSSRELCTWNPTENGKSIPEYWGLHLWNFWKKPKIYQNSYAIFIARTHFIAVPKDYVPIPAWTPLLLQNLFLVVYHNFIVSIFRTCRNWPPYWLPLDPALLSGIT